MTHTILLCLRFFPLLFLCCSILDAEDVKLREQAVQLMEGANAASLLAGYRDYHQVVSFTFHDPINGQITTGILPNFRRIGRPPRRIQLWYLPRRISDCRGSPVLDPNLQRGAGNSRTC
jgi:hypothetical protein